jgi:multiple sugar transport system substrate-binding protein
MKKIHFHRLLRAAVSLIVLALLVLLAGCGNPDNLTPESTDSVKTLTPAVSPTKAALTPTAQSTPLHLLVDEADLAGIVVRFVHPWTGEMAETLEQIAVEFSLNNAWDIWVEVESPGGETAMIESLAEDTAAGDIPGLIAAYPYQLDYFDGDLYSVNLTSYFENPTWGFGEEAQADIPRVFLEQFTVDGNLAALPVAPQATVLFYNQTWGEQLGFVSPPDDPETFQDQSCAATFANLQDYDEENNELGGWLMSFDPDVLVGWYHAFGGSLAGDGTLSFENETSQAAFGYLKSAKDKGCIWVGRLSDPYYYFTQRYALMFAGTLDQIPDQVAWMATEGNQDEWIAMGFPGSDEETILVNGPGLMLTADTPENQMAAWLFAKYLLEPEVQAKIVRSGFTLPVRESAMTLLDDFSTAYPQWAQGAELVDEAGTPPVSEEWGVGQWLLQDAVYRLFVLEIPEDSSIEAELTPILEELDSMLFELVEEEP